MNNEAILGLINNTALLLALAVVYATFPQHQMKRSRLLEILTGIVIGFIGLAVMLTPWKLSQGVIFDTRSILISMTGLFFGLLPTLVVVLMTGAYRIYLGGGGTLMGVAVILASAGLGLGWRYLLRARNKNPRWVALYGFGILVHLAMLLCTLFLPKELILVVLGQIWAPVMIIYPIGTVLLGMILTRQRERTELEQEVREDRDVFARVAETSPVGIVMLDQAGSIKYANARAEQILGLSREGITGRSYNAPEWKATNLQGSPFPEADLPFRRVMDTGKPVQNIIQAIEWPDGQRRTLSINAAPLRDDAGKVNGMVAALDDITRRKQAEDALQKSNELLSLFIQNSPVYTYIKEVSPTESRVLTASENFKEMIGIPGSEMVGKSMSELFPADLAARMTADDWAVVSGQKVLKLDEDLNGRHYTSIKFPIIQGEKNLLAGYTIDITDRKQAEEAIRTYSQRLEEEVAARTRELQAAQEQLVRQEKQAFLGQLAGGVGHELRNPLGVISNATYYLQLTRPNMDEKEKEYIHIIETEARNAEKIISDLLDLARPNFEERHPVTVSVSDLIHQALVLFPAPENVTIKSKLPDHLPPVFADPQQIVQILGNLTVNACQAMPGGGTLDLSAKKVGREIAISVTDTGSGVTPENMRKLFEPLFTTKTRGIGLGLALSRKLAEANAGRIEVQSEPGKGSIFTVYLQSNP